MQLAHPVRELIAGSPMYANSYTAHIVTILLQRQAKMVIPLKHPRWGGQSNNENLSVPLVDDWTTSFSLPSYLPTYKYKFILVERGLQIVQGH